MLFVAGRLGCGVAGGRVAGVGRGMIKSKGTAVRVFKAVADAGINIRMIDQGSSELNIIISVADEDFEQAIKVIYDTFANKKQ